MTPHKQWLDNEYAEWIKALGESTVHNFKEHPMVRRMLSLDLPEDAFIGRIDLPDVVLTNLLYKIDCIGRKKPLACFGGSLRRMVYYAQQILKLNPTSICEIGGGVGQFYAILRALGWRGIYSVKDLLLVRAFQDKYLAEVSKQTGLRLGMSKLKGYEQMLVSFYALGEFDDETKKDYERLIKHPDRGYIVFNPHSGASDSLSIFDSHNITVTPGIEEGVRIIQW